MSMSFPSREQVESIRKNYPPGTRVMLGNTDRMIGSRFVLFPMRVMGVLIGYLTLHS